MKTSPDPVAFDLGAAAFAAGRTATPVHDPALIAHLRATTSGEIGSSLPALTAWVSGWDRANAAAPVDVVLDGDCFDPCHDDREWS